MGYELLPWPGEGERCCSVDPEFSEDPAAHDPRCAVLLHCCGPTFLPKEGVTPIE